MRADKYFTERFGSRTKAQRALERGLVLKDGVALRPKDDVEEGAHITFLEEEETFVSYGGYKLARGLDAFGAEVSEKVFADLGASTGGFCDCLLQHGAKRVYCVDVGKSQLDSSLRDDGRVVVMDGTNARYLTAESFPEPLDGVTADLSFISLRLVLPAIASCLPVKGRAFVLVKPQFESEGLVGKSGILPPSRHEKILKGLYRFAMDYLSPLDIVNAPIRPKKNIEYIMLLEKGGSAVSLEEFLRRAKDLK